MKKMILLCLWICSPATADVDNCLVDLILPEDITIRRFGSRPINTQKTVLKYQEYLNSTLQKYNFRLRSSEVELASYRISFEFDPCPSAYSAYSAGSCVKIQLIEKKYGDAGIYGEQRFSFGGTGQGMMNFAGTGQGLGRRSKGSDDAAFKNAIQQIKNIHLHKGMRACPYANEQKDAD